jgi:hypothetical protein
MVVVFGGAKLAGMLLFGLVSRIVPPPIAVATGRAVPTPLIVRLSVLAGVYKFEAFLEEEREATATCGVCVSVNPDSGKLML